LSVQVGGEGHVQLVGVAGQKFLAGVEDVEVMGWIHRRGGHAVLLLALSADLAQGDLGLIDGQILGVQRYVLGVFQGFDQDLHRTGKAQVLRILQQCQNAEMVLLRAQRCGQAVVVVGGLDGFGGGVGGG